MSEGLLHASFLLPSSLPSRLFTLYTPLWRPYPQLSISDEALTILGQLRNAGSRMKVTKDFSLKALSELQEASGVEFALIKRGDDVLLLRGEIGQIYFPKHSQMLVHTHPGPNMFSARPSGIDIAGVARRGEASSIIVTENGWAVEYTGTGELLKLWKVR